MKIRSFSLLATLLFTGIASATPVIEAPIEEHVREFNSEMLPKAANLLEVLRARLASPKDRQLRRYVSELTGTLNRVRIEGSALESALATKKLGDIAEKYYQIEVGMQQFREWIDQCVIRAVAKEELKIDGDLLTLLEDFWVHEGFYRFRFRREFDRMKEVPNQ